MKSYKLVRNMGRVEGFFRIDEGPWMPLPPRQDLWNHSPTGFEMGYGGSGPAQAALAILAHCLEDDDRAVAFHQAFKWQTVARHHHSFKIDKSTVLKIIDEIERKENREQ